MKKTIITLSIIILTFATLKAQWQQVGNAIFSHHKIQEHTIAINSEGIPYILYITKDNPSYKEIRVVRFNGTIWETVGEENIIESNQFLVACPFIKIDTDDNLYISYQFNDVSNTEKFHTIVRKFNGTNWAKIGDFTSLVSTWAHASAFDIDNDGNPYIFYYAGDESVVGASTIQKYNGTDWEIISETTLTANSWVYHPGMTIDNDDNIYVAYADHADDAKRVRVDKYNGTNWENIGSEISEYGAMDQINPYTQQIVIDNNGNIHLACITDPQWGGGNMGYVFERYYFNGTEWIGGIVQDPLGMSVSLNTDNQGNVYCTYRIIDGVSQGFVQKFVSDEWISIGEQPVVDNFTLIHIAVDNTGTPYILYKDYSGDEQKSSVKKYINILSAENDIIDLTITGQVGETQFDNYNHTVLVNMPEGTNVTSLTPDIIVSDGATIDPASGTIFDFSEPVTCTVTAENGDEQEWQVAVHILTGFEDLSASKILIYPNPSNGIFTLQNLVGSLRPASVSITNITGKTIYSQQIVNRNSQFVINKKGIYFINIQTETGIYTEKLIIK